MQIIRDERLKLKNLRNIRIAFLFQTICIIGILIYDGVKYGLNAVMDNPLYLVILGTSILLGYLNITISVDVYDDHVKKPGPYYKTIFYSLAVGIIFSFITVLTPDGTTKTGIIVGSVLFLCFFCTFTFAYFLRKKRYNEFKDEDEEI
ncbi:branched-chain amino acid ABC transporter substrate-binding protein [Niallia sp. 03133]|uniref:branched-chain amino acid ABC transporter substrate-binding protein n=1 Tax=Niallia sp. 03133 TaxID=3458060 RepID=UPI004043B7C4